MAAMVMHPLRARQMLQINPLAHHCGGYLKLRCCYGKLAADQVHVPFMPVICGLSLQCIYAIQSAEAGQLRQVVHAGITRVEPAFSAEFCQITFDGTLCSSVRCRPAKGVSVRLPK